MMTDRERAVQKAAKKIYAAMRYERKGATPEWADDTWDSPGQVEAERVAWSITEDMYEYFVIGPIRHYDKKNKAW